MMEKDGGEIQIAKNPVDIQDGRRVVLDVLRGLREDITKSPRRFFGKFDPSIGSADLLALVDDRFSATCVAKVSKMIHNKQVMRFDTRDPVTVDDVRVVVYEFFRDLFFQRTRERDDGSSVFYDHLMGTVEEALDGQRLCGKASVLGGSKHDHREDVPKYVYPQFEDRDLLDPDLYYDRLDGDVTAHELEVLSGTVIQLVSGVTKIRNTDELFAEHGGGIYLSSDEATYAQLFRAMGVNLRTPFLKLDDRVHNMKTIGAKSLDDRFRIAHQTEMVYIPLSRILELTGQCRKLVDSCAGVLNPDLHKLFTALSDARKKGFRGSAVRKTLQDPENFGGIPSRVDIRPFGLEHFIAHIDRDIVDIDFEDLRVNDLHPMCEVVVLVSDISKVTEVAHLVPSVLKMEKYMIEESPRETVYEEKRVAVSAQQAVDRRRFIYKGVTIHGFSREFGGQITVRVVDRKNDYLSQRGVLAYRHYDKQPRDVIESVRGMVLEKEERGKNVDLLQLAQEKLLCQKTYFSTPNGDIVELPLGSTYLDAANAVNGDFVVGMQGVRVSRDLLSKTYEEKDPFEPLPAVARDDEKPVVSFTSCFPTMKDRDISKVKIDPCWLLFCKSGKTAEVMKKYFRDPNLYLHPEVDRNYLLADVEADSEVIFANGRAFFDRINSVLNLDVLSIMASKLRKTTRRLSMKDATNAVLHDVGSGDIDVLDRFMSSVKPAKSFTMEADVPDETGVFVKLLPYFEKAGLSVRPIKSRNRKDHDLFRFEVAYPGASENLDFKELVKTLVWISYKHNIQIIGGLNLM